jgi:hypothetical protein
MGNQMSAGMLKQRTATAVARILAPEIAYKPLSPDMYYDLSYTQFSQRIQQALRADEPFLVARLGSVEATNCLTTLWEQKAFWATRWLTSPFRGSTRTSALANAGIFPNDEVTIQRFSEIYLEAMTAIDLLGSWMHQEYYLRDRGYLPLAQTTHLENMVPFIGDDPWSYALEDKRVLVVHPFKDSIERQYARRELLFKDSRVLPEFEMIVYPAVQSIGGNSQFSSWIDALEHMKHDIAQLEFDVAILGCGGYGLPLGAYVKELGKQAIHLGGVTQCLFGIKGRRWVEDYGWDKLYFNEHWVYPAETERPEGADAVEDACYWGNEENASDG